MRAATTLLLSVLTAMTAWANDAVTYIDMDGNQQTVTGRQPADRDRVHRSDREHDGGWEKSRIAQVIRNFSDETVD